MTAYQHVRWRDYANADTTWRDYANATTLIIHIYSPIKQ